MPFKYWLTRYVTIIVRKCPGTEDTISDSTGEATASGTGDTLSDEVGEVS